MTTYNIRVVKSLTKDDAYSILTTALEGGYAEEFEVQDHLRRDSDSYIVSARLHCPEHDVSADDAGPFGVLRPEDLSRVDTWAIGPGAIARGLQTYADKIASGSIEGGSYLAEEFGRALSDGWDAFDAIGADAVLQFACFGEVVFG